MAAKIRAKSLLNLSYSPQAKMERAKMSGTRSNPTHADREVRSDERNDAQNEPLAENGVTSDAALLQTEPAKNLDPDPETAEREQSGRSADIRASIRSLHLHQIQDAKDRIRRTHRLPHEKTYLFKEGSIDQLLSRLTRMSDDEVSHFGRGLSSDELAQLAAAFAYNLYAVERKRIHQICLERCSWLSFSRAFNVFQSIFPNPDLQKLLSDMAFQLRFEEGKGQRRPLIFKNCFVDFAPLNGNERDLLAALVQQAGHAQDQGESLEAFCERYQILMQTPFGESFIAACFSELPLRFAYQERRLLDRMLLTFPEPAISKIAKKIIADQLLDDDQKLELYHLLRTHLLRPGFEHPAFSRIPEVERQRFKQWFISDVLYQYCGGDDARFKFLVPNLDRCLDIAQVGQTLALRFRGFAILLNADPHSTALYYYDDASLKRLLENNYSMDRLALPDFPMRSANEAIDAFVKDQPIRLGLLADEIRGAKRYYDWVCGRKQALEDAPHGILSHLFET